VSDISDPDRAGRGDRKKAKKLIDAAYAAGRLTAANRTLRMDRVDSAQTKGDLAILVRDLSEPAAAAGAAVPPVTTTASPTAPSQGTASLGSAIPPDQLSAMAKRGGSVPTIDLSGAMGSAMTGDSVKRVRRIVLIVLVGFLLLCGLGIAGVVTAVFSGINNIGDSGGEAPAPSVNLQTADGWSELVAAIDKETGTSRVYDAVIYPEYASINAIADEGAMRYVYRDGAFQLFNSPVTPAQGKPIDLADIEPDLVEGLPDKTAKLQDMPEYDSAYLIVNTLSGQPGIMVYVQQTGRLSRWSIYDLDGKVIGGTPE